MIWASLPVRVEHTVVFDGDGGDQAEPMPPGDGGGAHAELRGELVGREQAVGSAVGGFGLVVQRWAALTGVVEVAAAAVDAPRREQTLPPPGGDGVRADTELASGFLDGEHALGA
jgi:hypothetical protein